MAKILVRIETGYGNGSGSEIDVGYDLGSDRVWVL